MVDIGFEVFSKAWRAETVLFEREVDRATMWGLREVGRRVKRNARRIVPVYKGPGVVSKKAHKAARAAGQSDGLHGPPVRGMLRDSIGSSRRLKRPAPGEYALVVGPRGLRPHLYAQKIEAQAHYMSGSFESIRGEISAIHAVGWERAMRKAGRF